MKVRRNNKNKNRCEQRGKLYGMCKYQWVGHGYDGSARQILCKAHAMFSTH